MFWVGLFFLLALSTTGLATAPAAVEALRTLDVSSVAVATPYVEFVNEAERDALLAARELLPRETLQFHWQNAAPATGAAFGSFDEFLGTLSQDKRKKIRQERRRVALTKWLTALS